MADDNNEEIEEKILDAEGQPEGQKTAEPEKKKGLRKYLGFLSFIPRFYKKYTVLSIAISLVLILAIAGSAAMYFLFWNKKETSEDQPIQYAASYHALPELKLSIKRSDDNLGYLIIGLTLKLPVDVKPEELRKKEPEILDALHTYFASITLDSLGASAATSLVSPVGLERLRQNLIRRLNTVLLPIKIESILFRKLITQ
ncbi:flagellar basal body-associated FliL family protein [Candidatus Bodocaedibacter vickermanii]|uniref:Flagellar protein FliL n=1 Tax=Candidatus Bodocaedibacter vickermanii TaxID=2741701 RepID=A0A7L9RTW7_9PROT|nr:flagellar basal body-associated protein FliL [Candidatus Paracaedibacteraceae bacterium 'Lake Konstanz']